MKFYQTEKEVKFGSGHANYSVIDIRENQIVYILTPDYTGEFYYIHQRQGMKTHKTRFSKKPNFVLKNGGK